MQLKGSFRFVCFLVLVSVIGLSAISFGQEEVSRANTLVIGYLREASTLDVHTQYDAEFGIALQGSYEGLVQWDAAKNDIVPLLATSWDISPDATTYTFHLREGVLFQDGTPFDAEAVCFNVKRIMTLNKGPAWKLNDYVESYKALDPYTVVFHMKKSVPTWLNLLVGEWGLLMISPTAVQQHATDADPWAENWLREHAVGTGPYKIVEYVPGQQIVGIKFQEYWRGWNGRHFPKYILRFIHESSTQRMLLEKGELDMVAMPLTVTDIDALQKEKNITVEFNPSLLMWRVAVFCQRKPLDNPLVRRALRYAMDYDSIVHGLMGSIMGSLVTHGILFDSALEGFDPTSPSPDHYDLDEARKLLTQAGYPHGGFSLTMAFMEGQDLWRRIAVLYQSDLQKLGITLKIQTVTLSTALSTLASKGEDHPDLYLGPNMPDGGVMGWLYSATSAALPSKGGTNFSWYINPMVDILVNKLAAMEPDPLTRASLFRGAAYIIDADAPRMNVVRLNDIIIKRNDIKGGIYNPWWLYCLPIYDLYRE
ncbi:MAG: hypothetical protein GWP10_14175 [Nitrospiraceae bacterium]|nr:hypothetical protein [Nitrospiraceae bacterium]